MIYSGTTNCYWLPLTATGLLALTLVAAPFFLAATPPWARLSVEVALSVSIIIWVTATSPSAKQIALLALPLLLGLLQVTPLPDALLFSLAPASAGAWKVALAGLTPEWGRVSVDPATTMSAVCRGYTAAGAIVVTAWLGTKPTCRKHLALAISLTSLLILLTALAFPAKNQIMLGGLVSLRGPFNWGETPILDASETAAFGRQSTTNAGSFSFNQIEWQVGDGFGSFVTPNQFAFAALATTPVLIGAILHYTSKLPSLLWLLGPSLATFLITGEAWLLLLPARSRAGSASFILGAIAFVALISRGRYPKIATSASFIAAAVAVLMFALILYSPLNEIWRVLPENLHPSLSRLFTDGRVIATRTALRMLWASPVLGTGIGTYGLLYPRFGDGAAPWYYAHNDYAQLLCEAGIFGLLIILTAGYTLTTSFTRWRSQGDATPRFIDAGIWAALVGIAAHSLFDFNLHVPANCFIACIIAGLALSSAQTSLTATRHEPPSGVAQDDTRRPHRRLPRLTRPSVAFGTILVAALLARDAASVGAKTELRKAITAYRIATNKVPKESAIEKLHKAIATGESSIAWDPANGQLAMLIGQAHVAAAADPATTKNEETGVYLTSAAEWFNYARRRSACLQGFPKRSSGTSNQGRL